MCTSGARPCGRHPGQQLAAAVAAVTACVVGQFGAVPQRRQRATPAGAACCGGAGRPPGAPPFFTSLDEYDRTVRMLVDTGVILDPGHDLLGRAPVGEFPDGRGPGGRRAGDGRRNGVAGHADQGRGDDGARRARGQGDDLGRLPPGRAAGGVLEGRPRRAVAAARWIWSTVAGRCRRASSWARWCNGCARRWMHSVNTTASSTNSTASSAQGNGAMRQLRAWQQARRDDGRHRRGRRCHTELSYAECVTLVAVSVLRGDRAGERMVTPHARHQQQPPSGYGRLYARDNAPFTNL